MIALLQSEPNVMGGVETAFRWIHVVAGVLWIGLLYFFNWVNGPFVATLDAETKRKVVPELLPRGLFFFRFGALYTFVFGLFLLFYAYYMTGDNFFRPLTENAGTKPAFGVWIQPFAGILIGFALYDLLFKTLGKTQHAVAAIVWAVLAIGFAAYLIGVLEASQRCAFIHVGALFGTAMAANVWMRIWPAQRRIITAVKNGDSPDPADTAMAGLRSKHNTYMSVPLLLLMVSVHVPWLLGFEPWWGVLAGILVVGWAVTKAVYAKAAKVPGF